MLRPKYVYDRVWKVLSSILRLNSAYDRVLKVLPCRLRPNSAYGGVLVVLSSTLRPVYSHGQSENWEGGLSRDCRVVLYEGATKKKKRQRRTCSGVMFVSTSYTSSSIDSALPSPSSSSMPRCCWIWCARREPRRGGDQKAARTTRCYGRGIIYYFILRLLT